MVEENVGVSFNPDEAIAGFEKFIGRGTVVSAKAAILQYGDGGIKAPCIHLEIKDTNGVMHEIEESMGSINDWQPSQDGTTFVRVGTATKFRLSSNAMMLLTSLANAGFPKDKMGAELNFMDGLDAEFDQIAVKREGLKGREDRQMTVTHVTKIYSLPGEKSAKGAGKKAAAGKAATPAAAAGPTGVDAELDEAVQGLVMEVLAEQSEPIQKNSLASAVFKKLPADWKQDRKNAALKLVFDPTGAWHKDKPWKCEGGLVSMG